MQHRNLIIIGAGPAGLSAGIYAHYFGLEAFIFEENIPGGLTAEIPVLENYPGFSKRQLSACQVGGYSLIIYKRDLG